MFVSLIERPGVGKAAASEGDVSRDDDLAGAQHVYLGTVLSRMMAEIDARLHFRFEHSALLLW